MRLDPASKRPEAVLPGGIGPLPATRRGSWLGGPGFIFLLLLVLIIAGGALYLQATGRMGELSAGSGIMPAGAGGANATPGTGEGPVMTPMQASDTPAATGTAPAQPITFVPMGPADLLAKRPPPRSLRLQPGAFDLPPVRRNARPALFVGSGPRVAVVVVSLGLNRAVSAAAIADLPPEISLSFSPYASDLAAWIDAARAYGHEVMLDLPLEQHTYPQDDPGELGLLTALNEDENLRRLDQLLGGNDGILGLAAPSGDRFIGDAKALHPVLAELGSRGLGFIAPGDGSIAEALAGISAPPPVAAIDITVPQDQSRQAIARLLETLMEQAGSSSRQRALAAVQPYPLSIAALTALAAAAKRSGLVLVPASSILNAE